MSIKTTYMVTREFAIAAIQFKLMTMDNNTLANTLEEVLHNGYYNFEIVSKEQLEEEKGNPYRHYLDDLTNLPEYNDAW